MSEPDSEAGALPWGTRLRRGATIALVSLALIALGLRLTGRDAEALRAWRRLSLGPASLHPITGSRFAPRRSQRALGQSETVQACLSDEPIAAVIAHYEALARRRALAVPGRGRPYLKSVGAELGLLVWREAGGRRCGVAAYPLSSARGTRYLLFEGGRPGPGIPGDPLVSPVMPLGIEAPAGSRALFDVRHAGGALAYYEVPQSPSRLAASLRARLEAAGCRVSSERGGVLSFAAGARRGVASLKPGPAPGTSALSLVVRGLEEEAER